MSEYKPTEYIVDFGDYKSNQFVRLSMALIEQNGVKLQEKITRCRDCCNRAGENEQAVDPYFCIFHRMHVQPNFFCAWGEPRGVSV